uniref:Uncharacterized protein n=1 Tax=Cuerna arida TaxID=1464854 RepID=A0A1B6GD71_9HEMI
MSAGMERLVETTVPNLSELMPGVVPWNNSLCLNNCSGHGECSNGVCICEIQFEGAECRRTNASYFVGLASVFLTLALVCLVQLVVCCLAEWQRMKAPSLLHACRVTTQKLLYFLVFLASSLRGAYFTSPTAFADGWSSSLMSAYYPLLLSGSSLIVCFWAEVFHLRDIRWEKSQFLSKSFLAFATFNLITYSLLVAEFYTIHYLDTSPHLRNFYIHVFNGCYAVLLFIVVVFFLIYGIQVFVKVRAGFLLELENTKNFQYKQIFHSQESLIDTSQLHQSRIGLLSQTLMLSFIILFLCSETLSEFWKNKVPLHSRNWHDLLFRLVEIGVALWFPCVLWNCTSPEQLWILNPKRIIKNLDVDIYQLEQTKQENMEEQQGEDACFICQYPCDHRVCLCCFAHQTCLTKWCTKCGDVKCRYCQAPYPVVLEPGSMDWRTCCSLNYLRRMALLLVVVCLTAVAVRQVVCQQEPVFGPIVLGFFLLVLYICVKCMWQNTDSALKQANNAGLKVHVIPDSITASPSEMVCLNSPISVSDTATVIQI